MDNLLDIPNCPFRIVHYFLKTLKKKILYGNKMNFC